MDPTLPDNMTLDQPPLPAHRRLAPLVGTGMPLDRAEPIRHRTLVGLRWVALAGQASAVLAALVLGAQLPVGPVGAVILLGAAVNVALGLRHPRMTPRRALAQLMMDTVQTGLLLTLTGGTGNPFALFVLAPLTLGAGVLPRGHLTALGAVTAGMVLLMTTASVPLELAPDAPMTLPLALGAGHVLALAIGGASFAVSAFRVASELADTQTALAATQMGLAREQRLQHLGGVVAAAAHEMGTPLATIKLVAAELADELAGDLAHRPEVAADLALLRSSVDRCRDILGSMGKAGKDDLHLHTAPLAEVLAEAAAPHLDRGRAIEIVDATGLIVRRDPGLIHALRNLVQNAVDHARSQVLVTAAAQADTVTVTIRDDGAGYPLTLIDRLGEPYLTTRSPRPGDEGMGLGLFIGRTLLERGGGRIDFFNDRGAVARVTWPRSALEADDRAALTPNPAISD